VTRIAAPTGEQFHLRHDGAHGTVEATITEVAAALRQLSVDGHALVQGFPRESTPPFGHGIVLAPWPNRVRDGRWVHEGTVLQLDITEVERNNAIHGLLRNTPYRVVEKWDDSVTLGAAVVPQHGWPFHLWTTVQYALTGNGIRVTHSATNIGTHAAPIAFGTHPFLAVGEHPVEELTLTARTVEHVIVDDRLNPEGLEPVEGTRFDLTGGVAVKARRARRRRHRAHRALGARRHRDRAVAGPRVGVAAGLRHPHLPRRERPADRDRGRADDGPGRRAQQRDRPALAAARRLLVGQLGHLPARVEHPSSPLKPAPKPRVPVKWGHRCAIEDARRLV